MSITLDVNAFLNKDVCSTGCDDIVMEKEMETNIFDEIEHLLKFNKNLEYENQHKEEETRKRKVEEAKPEESINLDFLNSTSDDFLLTSDSQSLLGEDTLLFTVEQDRLQPVSSRFMVPGIYKRIEGVALNETKPVEQKSNVFISELEKRGRIVSQKDFERLYMQTEECESPTIRRVILLQPMESDDDQEDAEVVDQPEIKTATKGKTAKDKIPKEWDALNRLAYDILKLTNRDHIVIDRKRNEIVRTQFHTHQKTIYRFLSPEMLGLKSSSEEETKVIDLEAEENFQMTQKPINKLGRPRKTLTHNKVIKKSNKINKNIENPKTISIDNKVQININGNLRTRSGRLVKTLNKSPENIHSLLAPPSPQESLTNLLNDLKDSDYQCSKLDATAQQSTNEAVTSVETAAEVPQSPKRKVPPEAICPTCKKIFLGKRLQKHFAQNPNHMQISPPQNSSQLNSNQLSQPIEEMSLFRFLISKLQKSQTLNEDQKADLFLNELNDLVEQLQLRSSRLIRNTSGLHFVNQRCAKLLGIPEGQYALDLAAIEAPLDPELSNQYENANTQNQHSQPHNISTRSLDYTNLSITLDDTLTDEAAQKLNLSAGGKLLPPSEESLLRAVDDLVQTDIDKIHASSMLQQQPVANTNSMSTTANATPVVVAKLLPPHIDHASDNAVEAVHMKETTTAGNTSENPLLDLSVDFFQFNN
ncbi:uncharacterized protein ACRADG_008296 [Cochliomyia hominivorax]